MRALSSILNLIPPPLFLTMPSAGVDISDTSIKYVRFTKRSRYGHELKLHNWGNIDLEENTFQRGEIVDQDKFVAAMKEVADAMETQYVRVSLPEERAYIFETEVKRGTSAEEIQGLLEFRLEENVPISPRDAYFDYDIIEDSLRKDILRVVVTVYDKKLIEGYYEGCLAAGLIPLSFEVEAEAIARSTISKSDPKTHMIVDFGKTRSGVGIVHQGALMYTSTIDIGGQELSRTLRRAVGDLTESELTKIKNTQGLVRGADNSDVHDALITLVSVIKDEIYTRIEYWQTKEHHRQEREIDSIILCGGSANLKGLPEYFTETLGVRTVRADIWKNAFDIETTLPPIGRRYSYGYATAVGLALAGFDDRI